MAAAESDREVPSVLCTEFLNFSAKDTASKWLQVTDLYKEVYQHLARYVPKIYCLGPNLNPQSEDLLAQLLLQAPLEWECAADPTCVLCMQCFLGSVHKEHRYRMTTSGGGGFCDCGDTEAWKKGPYYMIARCYNVFSIVLKYAVDMLTWDKENELPLGLEPPDRGDTYYCMLFNDEVHTYEQVIYTLQKAVNCTQKEAVSFATTVDRDRNTSRQSKPLRVQVMHSSVVAHQCFALKALHWLGHVIGYSDALRRILCQVGLERGPEGENSSLVDTLMLWARNVYHQLFMSSLLMDLKYKKLFAIQFAKNYRRLQTDFMEDDHERVVSVTSLSVQLFTVPTMNYERLQSDYVKDDHDREFSVTDLSVQMFTVPSLARMLITEENLMTTIIRTFVDHLRHRDLQGRFQEKFLEGLDTFLELFKCMQERVLIEAYKKCLTALTHCHSGFTDGEQPITLSICGHSVDTIRYCVSQEKVSIHLPVSRLLAGLHVLLSKMEVAYRFPEQLPLSELSPPMLIEHPLRCLVLCAQVHAGMWRRNGFSLVNQIYYYHNVKCRVEMFDKDLIMLQAGASMMDPNHFLMIVLSRFELYHIFSSADCRKRYNRENTNKDVVQQNNTLIEEMLHLIMMVVGERFEAGVGQVEGCDQIKREIIHQLCIRPMAHSELVKALPENENKETGMERVIDCVASFKKPGVTGRGLYELRPECAKQFNLYFHHYSRADQSKAEEAQRKLKRQNGEDTALHPPVLPLFSPLFASLVNILQCDVLLGMLGAVLQWAVEPSGGHWSESMLQRVLHLIGMGLLEEQQQLENSSEDNDVSFNFTLKISRPGEAPSNTASVLALLENLQNAHHLEVHKDMIRWILKTVASIKTIRELTAFTCTVTASGSHGQEEMVCDKDKAERKRKMEMARLRREKIMAQMSEMQRHFINENKELFQQSLEELDASTSSSLEHSPTSSDAALVCVGPRRSCPREKRQVVTCILCQEEQEIRADGKAMVLAAFVQRSTHYDPLFMHPDLSFGTHTGSCGHIMHSHCWQRYFEAVQAKEQRRQQRLRVHTSYDVGNGEFLCPLCECLSNTSASIFPLSSCEQPGLGQWLKTSGQQIKAMHSAHRKLQPISVDAVEETVEEGCPAPEGFRVDHTPTSPYSSTIKEMLTTFGTATYKVGLKRLLVDEEKPLFGSKRRQPLLLTYESVDRSLIGSSVMWRGAKTYLTLGFDDCLSSLARFGSACWTAASQPSVQGHFIRLVAALIPDPQVETSPCILDIDMLHLLVSVVLSYGSVHSQDSSGLSVDAVQLHLFHLITVAHMVQILLTSGPEEVTMEQESEGAEREEEEAICCLYNTLRTHLGSSLPEVGSGWHLWRCWEVLCGYLSLPSNLLQLYHSQQELLEPLLHGWCSHPSLRQTLQGGGVLVSFPRESNSLIDLPDDYSALINQASSFTYCCQTELDGEDVGACTAHTFACGAGGCFYAPPYLDDYGETDQGLRRGNPLHLCRERYRKIQKLWRQHSITEEIGHAQEANQTLVGIDWQHL
ncbi:unnamed protein product [Coregonus sp. 'balchen']|nr:unnamed protein product [Coregonus sp. 'balchen']